MKKFKECEKQKKICNPKTGRCIKTKVVKPNKKVEKIHLSMVQKKLLSIKPVSDVLQTSPAYSPTSPAYSPTSPAYSPKKEIKVKKPIMKSYSPEANKELVSIKMHSKSRDKKFWLTTKMTELYNCKDKLKVKINNKCVGYKNKEAQEIMIQLLYYRDSRAINPNYVIGPAQILSNCWLNSFFMCYFISDKGRKFFRYFRRVMITGEKEVGGKQIENKYRKGLWLLNKIIQSSLFSVYSDMEKKYNAFDFITHTDTNDVIRLLRGKGNREEKRIVKSRKAYNPLNFYQTLFEILGINKGVYFTQVSLKSEYDIIFKKNRGNKNSKTELIIIERRDDSDGGYIDSKKDKVPKEFTYNKSKYVLDSAVLRSIDKKHFTSYVTIGGQEFAFEGGAFRRLRPMTWKNRLVKGRDQTWSFGSPLQSKKLSQRKDGFILNEQFNFTKGYQILFYYKV